MIRFLLVVALASAFLLASTYAGYSWHWIDRIPSFTLAIVLFVGVCTAGLFYFILRKSDSPDLIRTYLLSIVLKMFGYSAFVLIIISADRAEAFGNASVFLISYFLFTALEVGFLFLKINR